MSDTSDLKKTLRPFVDYVPAQVAVGKIFRVVYYAYNPATEKLERKVVKCNRLADRRDNKKYAQIVADAINQKLLKGWNPFLEENALRGHVLLGKAVEKFITSKKKDLRKDSIRSYLSHTNAFTEWLKAEGLNNSIVSAFASRDAIRYMESIENKEVSNKTYNNCLRFMKTLFLWFVEKEYTKTNPFEKLKPKRVDEKLREALPPDVRERIKTYIEQNDMHEYYCIMQLCYRCFVRPKEILMLKCGMVDLRSRTLRIPSTVAKNHKDRIIALPQDIFDFLANHLEGVAKDSYIFSKGYRPGKEMLTSRDTARTWSQMRKALGLPMEYKFYSLKDTGITEMLERGVPTKLVKELADHHSLEMTEKYIHRSSVYEILKYDDLEF